MLVFRKYLFKSFCKQLHRSAYFDIAQNAKISISGSSAFNVACLPPHEVDKSCVHIPDNSLFAVNDGHISQNKDVTSKCLSKIKIPIHRDVDIVQHSTDPLHFTKYEGYTAFINSKGPVHLEKLKIVNLSIQSCADINSVGYIEGNFSATTTASMNIDNLTCGDVKLLFGGTSCKVQSAYCNSMTLKSITPEAPFDEVTHIEQAPLNISFGTLHGNVDLEIDGAAELNIGSFEGTMNIRQRLGNISLHIAGPCPLLEIDVAEGNIELSLPLGSFSSSVAGFLDIYASNIELDRNTISANRFDNWDIDEEPGMRRFCGKFGSTDPKVESIWRIRTLRGNVKVTAASWAEAMINYLQRSGQT